MNDLFEDMVGPIVQISAPYFVIKEQIERVSIDYVNRMLTFECVGFPASVSREYCKKFYHDGVILNTISIQSVDKNNKLVKVFTVSNAWIQGLDYRSFPINRTTVIIEWVL